MSTDKFKLFKNFLSLSSVQLANYILPFIAIPYIVRVVGPEKYGLISFAQAFVLYFSLFVNYGFNLSATREISANRENSKAISEIFSATLSTKFLLFIISSLFYLFILISFEKFSNEYLLFLVAYATVIGDLTFPLWLYQGMERLAYVATINMLNKILFTSLIFVLITSETDYLLVPAVYSAGNILVGIYALYKAFKMFNIKFTIPNFESIKLALKDAWLVFASTIVINLYTTSNTVILGFFTSPERVGYFAGAAKIISGVMGLTLYPMNQVLYPYMGRMFHKNKNEGISKIKNLILIIGSLTLVLSIMVFSFAEQIVVIFLGGKFKSSIMVLKVLSFFPFIVGLSNILGIQGLLNMKMDKEFFIVTGIGAILNFALNIALIPAFKEVGTAIAWLITEIYITASFTFIYFAKGINLFKF